MTREEALALPATGPVPLAIPNFPPILRVLGEFTLMHLAVAVHKNDAARTCAPIKPLDADASAR